MKPKSYRTQHQVVYILSLLAFLFFNPCLSFSQEEKTVPDGTEGEVLNIPSADTAEVKKKNLAWNEFDLKFTTIKFGAAVLVDYATFSQDEEGEAQMDSLNASLVSKFKVRDFRVLVGGRFNTKRTITWKAGIIYDGATDTWRFRETGFTIGVPELSSHVFIGRTKEGFSFNKVMSGYAVWGFERQMSLDVIPILADGIKWFGFLPKSRIFWNTGIYADWLSEGQGFSKFNWQFAARVGWMPVYNTSSNTLLHIGASYRYGEPLNGTMRLRSKPEADIAPYYVDTGNFDSEHSNHVGGEIYYSRGPLMLGSEVFLHSFQSIQAGDPTFSGGEIVATYILTGESRPYSTVGSVYSFVPVDDPLFKGGAGAWEAVLRFTWFDLDGGTVSGGKFWRITPMINWYMNKALRMEFGYGYGVLDRFNLNGATHFFQSRIQIFIN